MESSCWLGGREIEFSQRTPLYYDDSEVFSMCHVPCTELCNLEVEFLRHPIQVKIIQNSNCVKLSLAKRVIKTQYINVAAARPPSPVVNSEEEVPLPPSQNTIQGQKQSVTNRIPTEATHVVHNEGNATMSESGDSGQDDNPQEWTTVQRKHCSKKYST